MADAYFNNAVDTDINTAGNWWTDSSFTSSYGGVPDFTSSSLVLQIGNGVSSITAYTNISITANCDFTITNASTLNVNSIFDTGSTCNLTVDAGGAVYVNYISPGTLGGTVINNGIFSVGDSAASYLYISGTFTNSGTLDIYLYSTVHVNGGTFTLGAGCTNGGVITSTSGATITAASGLAGSGSMTIAAGASLSISGGTFSNDLTNNGTTTVSLGATFSPSGQTNNGGSFTNNGILTQTSTFVNSGTLTLNNLSTNTFSESIVTSGTLDIKANVSVVTLLISSGTVDINHASSPGVSAGRLNMQGLGILNITNGSLTLTNNALDHNLFGSTTIGSSGSLTITSGTARCGGSLVNDGAFTINDTLIVSGPLDNNGTMTIAGIGVLGLGSNSLVLTNNGTFTFGSYTTKFKGKIFPQVPSSASWGNALL